MRKEQILVYLIGNKYQTLKYIERLVKAGSSKNHKYEYRYTYDLQICKDGTKIFNINF